jgi:D-alanine-D-alanine ligase
MCRNVDMTALRVVILHQAVLSSSPLDELDVLAEVRAVRAALKTLGHKTSVLSMSASLDDAYRALVRARPDCVFNLVESLMGFGGLATAATALLDTSRIAYTGSATAAMALTTNKVAAKHALRREGIATPAWVTCRAHTNFRPGTYVIKPVSEDASVGLDENSLVHVGSLSQCQSEIAQRSRPIGRELFAERFIEGREFNVSLLGSAQAPRVLPIAEISFKGFRERGIPEVVGYRAKWEKHSYEYQNTPRSFDAAAANVSLRRQLSQVSEAAWEVLGCSGYARVDLRLDRRGVAHVLEINVNPCIAPDAGFAAAAKRAGLDYPSLVAEILRAALDG